MGSGMSIVKVGDRVGAYMSISGDKAFFFGFGTYVGDEVPPNEGFQSLTSYLSGLRQANPKIVLDNGDVVWGCECWWGAEDQVKAEMAKLAHVINVDIKDARRGVLPEGAEEHMPPSAKWATDDFW